MAGTDTDTDIDRQPHGGEPREHDDVEARAERSGNAVSVLVIVSRITGFLRTSVQAWAIGAAGLASAYTVANNLPNTLYELVMGGMLITAFLPVYLKVKERCGREGANAYTSNLLSLVLIVMGVLTVLCFVFAVPIVWTQSAGASEGFDSDLAVWFFRWFMCEIVLYALSSIISGVLNAERDYLWSNAAPIFNNLIVIASFVIYSYLVAAGVPWRTAAISLAIGNPLGVAVQVAVQLPALRRYGVRVSLKVDLHDPALRDTFRIGIPTLVATIASTPTSAVMSSCALSVTEAGASIAYYARVWYVLPYSIFAIPISVTMFTELSQSHMAGDLGRFREYLESGIRKIFFTLIPMTMFLIVFAPSLVAVFTSGSFTEEAAEMTVGYLRALSLALPFYGLMTYLQKTCSAMMQMWLYAVATCVASAVQVVVCIVGTPIGGLYVVPLTSVLFYGTIDVVTLVYIRRKLGHVGLRAILGTCLRAALLGLAGALVGWAVLEWLTAAFGACSGMLEGFLYTIAGGVPAVLVTFGGAYLLGVCESPFFEAIFARVAAIARRVLPRRG